MSSFGGFLESRELILFNAIADSANESEPRTFDF